MSCSGWWNSLSPPPPLSLLSPPSGRCQYLLHSMCSPDLHTCFLEVSCLQKERSPVCRERPLRSVMVEQHVQRLTGPSSLSQPQPSVLPQRHSAAGLQATHCSTHKHRPEEGDPVTLVFSHPTQLISKVCSVTLVNTSCITLLFAKILQARMMVRWWYDRINC